MDNKNYPTYFLPDNVDGKNVKKEMPKPNVNSVVIIGANGSGKSKLGAWIENQDRGKIHRIGSQRQISWSPNLQLGSFELLHNAFLYGRENLNEKNVNNNFFEWKDGKPYTERRDVNTVLSAVFAKYRLQLEEANEGVEIGQSMIRKRNIIDDIIDIWGKVFPQRKVSFKDNKVNASLDQRTFYNGNEMSDGERVGLYLIAQAILVPQNRIIIIDEPEIHLHRSIMYKLWSAIEEQRNDCLFIYISHDTHFAATHAQSDKIWIKSFDGTNWQWVKVMESKLPDQLLLELLGNRKPVLFIEGEKNSLDYQLFSLLYTNYYIIPCASYKDVQAYTIAVNSLKENQPLFDVTAVGILDRDFRCQSEIDNLTANKVYVLEVAEVENLFLIKDIILIVNEHLKQALLITEDKVDEVVTNIREEYKSKRHEQIEEAVGAEIHYMLLHKSFKTKHDFDTAVSEIEYDVIKDKRIVDFPENAGYHDVLKVFNHKGLKKFLIQSFNQKDYVGLVLRLASGEKKTEIRNALKPFLPQDIAIGTI